MERDAAEYERLAPLTALTFNANKDPKKGKATTPADWNPYASEDDRKQARKAGRARDAVSWSEMGELWKRQTGRPGDGVNASRDEGNGNGKVN